MHPRNGFLTAIAAFVEVDGSMARIADPTHFVRDGALVGVDAEPWAYRRHPVGFICPHPGRAHAGLRQTTLHVGEVAAVKQHVQLDLTLPRLGHPAYEAGS